MKYAGRKAKIASVGWCFGGGWSLQTAILAEKRAKDTQEGCFTAAYHLDSDHCHFSIGVGEFYFLFYSTQSSYKFSRSMK